MDKLIHSQHELQQRIGRTIENLKKTASAKLTLGVVQSTITLLDKKWNQLEEQHSELCAKYWTELVKNDYHTKDFISNAETTYLFQRGSLLDYERALRPKVDESRSEKSVAERTESTSSRSALPRIQLPEFSGEFEEWPEFRDLFLSIIRKDSSLSGVEKLHYLKTSLKGSAANLLKNLPIIEENFDRAWHMLTGHFENKRLLTQSYLSRFTALPKMKAETVSDISRIYHGMLSTIAALEGINRPITNCTDLFIHSIVERMTTRTRNEWEDAVCKSAEPPSLEELTKFMEHRMHTLEAISKATSTSRGENASRSARAHHVKQSPRTGRCPCCSKDHYILFCERYKEKDAKERKGILDKYNLCHNCLGRHMVSDCSSKKTCSKCAERHHTTVHDAFAAVKSSTFSGESSASSHVARRFRDDHAVVILATARVDVLDKFGTAHRVRVLIDPGSETSLASESLAQRLQLPRSHAAVTIFGVGGQKSAMAKGRINVRIISRVGSASFDTSALVLPRLTAYCGKMNVRRESWPHLQGLELADPDFLARDPVDLLLGADVYATILQQGLRKASPRAPIAQCTSLGWIISGHAGMSQHGAQVSSNQCSIAEELSSMVRKFWEQEEAPAAPPPLTAAEQECEEFFASTLSRQSDGRYIVRLPFASAIPDLSDTRRAAFRLLHAMERRFKHDSSFFELYSNFMEEYEQLSHMTRIQEPSSDESKAACYLPHHGVLRESSQSTKLRVVFNGSQQTAAGDSLNNSLLVGPNLLPALADVILRWRQHRFVLVTDVEKMYRQILVHPSDRRWQRVIWRCGQAIEEYQLNTVTYGLACAPFLAIRTLRQLADDEESRFPSGAKALRHDVYVDDVLTGAQSEEEARQLRDQLRELCKAGGFPLKKWASNSRALLRDLPPDHCQLQGLHDWQPLEKHSALGLQWDPNEDCFIFSIHQRQGTSSITKRSLLSEAAQLFDPLGWLAPIIVGAKLLIQSTWLQHLEWDSPLRENDAECWRRLRAELSLLANVRVPRWIQADVTNCRLQLHGFADASERAYAAVAYLRVEGEKGRTSISLILAKTKVAPLKRVSLPRLELCAASLLVKIVAHIKNVLAISPASIHLWSDSTVTLGWIRGHPARWSTYVANRVSEIQRTLPDAHWHHVRSEENPADCASRGLTPKALLAHSLWWNGPPFLAKESESWPRLKKLPSEDLPEQRSRAHLVVARERMQESEILVRFSSLSRLLRVTAWMLRWSKRIQLISGTEGVLSPEELLRAEKTWIGHVQSVAFNEEMSALRHDQPISNSSTLKRLTPFLDREGTLRVGGRLKHAVLSYDERHPVILPPRSHFTELVIQACHRRSLHGGTQLTLSLVRQKFWIPRGRLVTRSHIHRCVQCLRWRAATPQPAMADLPSTRVSPSRPFLHVGLDYAGPILLRTTRGRGHRAYKGFICIFICMSSRAVHLEVVSDYTSDAFLAAFRRFLSRRGLCKDVYSDCGTNFVGADAQLRSLFRAASPDAREIANGLANEGIRWHFNPPAAPHFGGIWEAAVKSVKHHLRRVIGDATLTFEEMTTLLTQVEACLNSRPLQALTDDPDDLSALTPGHLLIGEPICSLPEPCLIEVSNSRLSRWQLLQKMRDHLWQRWSQEYLQGLISRSKWWRTSQNLEVGQLCLIRSETSPPSKWPLARIIAVHPGKDGQVRVVTVRTAKGELTRPSVKIVTLPRAAENNFDR